MVLIPDPSGEQRLVATNQSDSILLTAGQLINYSLGVGLLEGNDTLQGSNDSEKVNGNSGDDMLIGFGGNDLLWGGQGEDYLVGNDGNDTLFSYS
ncbi:Iron-regulated protein FrpC [Planktothrix tepida]|uniref:Hemolysin-type calcium-binding region n=2 Tax=Planktothrix TaxID=54304 RepID=A0A1J1LPY2_9CYAN